MSLLNQSIIKHKMGLLSLAEELNNVSQACRVMGVSRDTFYRVKEAKESGGLEALLHKDRRRANLHIRVDEAVEAAILGFGLPFQCATCLRCKDRTNRCALCPAAQARRYAAPPQFFKRPHPWESRRKQRSRSCGR